MMTSPTTSSPFRIDISHRSIGHQLTPLSSLANITAHGLCTIRAPDSLLRKEFEHAALRDRLVLTSLSLTASRWDLRVVPAPEGTNEKARPVPLRLVARQKAERLREVVDVRHEPLIQHDFVRRTPTLIDVPGGCGQKTNIGTIQIK